MRENDVCRTTREDCNVIVKVPDSGILDGLHRSGSAGRDPTVGDP